MSSLSSKCPVCGIKLLSNDEIEISEHVDECLAKGFQVIYYTTNYLIFYSLLHHKKKVPVNQLFFHLLYPVLCALHV